MVVNPKDNDADSKSMLQVKLSSVLCIFIIFVTECSLNILLPIVDQIV